MSGGCYPTAYLQSASCATGAHRVQHGAGAAHGILLDDAPGTEYDGYHISSQPR